MFDKGEGVQRDYTKAVIWYRKAAEQGVVSAQFDLGNKYEMVKADELVINSQVKIKTLSKSF